MVVKGVFKLFRECLNLEFFGHKLCLKGEAFLAKVADLGCLIFHDSKLALEVTDAEFKKFYVFKTFLVLDLTLGKGGLEDLDLLVEQCKFVVSADELCS